MLKIGDDAPHVVLQDQDGQNFDLSRRKGEWTVLYFYPKADTPGCTKQACAFSSDLSKIRARGAGVFGISINSVAQQKKFQEKYNLNFKLLADERAVAAKAFGAKMLFLSIAKRWTFLIGPDLKIKWIFKDVSPSKDSKQVDQKLAELQKT